MRSSLKRKLMYLASGVAVVAVGLGAMWLFLTPTIGYDSLDAKTPDSYEAVFEVFMAAAKRHADEGGLLVGADAAGAGTGAGAGADEAAESDHDEPYLGDDELWVEEEPDPAIAAGEEFMSEAEAAAAFEEETQADSDWDGADEYLDDEYLDEDYDLADDEFYDEETADYYDEEDAAIYFDDTDIFRNQHNIALEFSPLTLMQLADAGAQNPARSLAVSAEGTGAYLYVVAGEQIRILSLDADGALSDAGVIAAAEMMAGTVLPDDNWHMRYINIFVAGDRLVSLSTLLPRPYSEQADASVEATVTAAEDDAADADADAATASEIPVTPLPEPVDDLSGSSGEAADDPSGTAVQIFDISTPQAPQLVEAYHMTGVYLGSRMMAHVLYVATDYGIFNYDHLRVDEPQGYIPFVTRAGSGDTTLVLPQDIRISADIDRRDTSYTMLAGIAVDGDSELISQAAFLGGTDILYGGAGELFLSNTTEIGQGRTFAMASYITRLNLSDGQLAFGPTITLEGVVEGPEAMSESGGKLRVAAPVYTYVAALGSAPGDGAGSDFKTQMQVYVLDENFEVAGHLDGFGDGQELFPRGFVGDILFLTSPEIDQPEYAVDFSNPAAPRIITGQIDTLLPEVLMPFEGNLWVGLDVASDAVDEQGQLIDPESDYVDDAGILLLSMHELGSAADAGTGTGAGAGVYDRVLNQSDIEGFYSSEAFIDRESFFADGASGTLAFPADGSYLVYRYDDTTGFTRVLDKELRAEFDPLAYQRALVAGDYFVLISSVGQLDIWVFALSDFSETGSLNFSY